MTAVMKSVRLDILDWLEEVLWGEENDNFLDFDQNVFNFCL